MLRRYTQYTAVLEKKKLQLPSVEFLDEKNETMSIFKRLRVTKSRLIPYFKFAECYTAIGQDKKWSTLENSHWFPLSGSFTILFMHVHCIVRTIVGRAAYPSSLHHLYNQSAKDCAEGGTFLGTVAMFMTCFFTNPTCIGISIKRACAATWLFLQNKKGL